MTDAEAAEFYRDKLADWMIAHDISTGSNGQTFEELLEALGEHIAALQQQRIHGE
jgi:hypothetical protein